MKKRYIYTISYSLIGLAVGYLIGQLLIYGWVFLNLIFNIGGSETMWQLNFLSGLLTVVSPYIFLVIGLIIGWNYGYKIGIKKEETSNKT